MIVKMLLLCGAIGLGTADPHGRYPKSLSHRQRLEHHRSSAKPPSSSLPGEHWGTELGEEQDSESLSLNYSHQEPTDEYGAENHQPPRNDNWCSSVRSRLITYVATCKTEKYIIRSQQACPDGTPDCQKILYRVALKPVYQVKQQAVSSLHWKCCPGFIGKNCEHHDPNFLPVPTYHLEGQEEGRDTFASQISPSLESGDIMEAHQSQEAMLEGLQNDIQQATNNLEVLQQVVYGNLSSERPDVNHNRSEVQEQFLQQILLPHIEGFLRGSFNPVWASFNKSLQTLSVALKNLSQAVEANQKSIEKFQASTVPKKDFQELGTKFESKVQDNVLKVEQMKTETLNHLHLQQAALHFNLTMIKAETDMKLKRYHKIQHSNLLSLNNSITDMRQQQDKLLKELEVLNRNLDVLPIQHSSPNEEATKREIKILNQTLAGHEQQLKDIYDESDEIYEDLTKLQNLVKDFKENSKHEIELLRIDLMEKSLIMDEYKDDLERKILDLNDTLTNIQSHRDLQRFMKACHCRKLSSDTETDDQANITQINRVEREQLDACLTDLKNKITDLTKAFPLIHESLASQQEHTRQLEGGMALLKFQTQNLTEDISSLEKKDKLMHGHIKYLNSSFNSLLEDAIRHETALEALLGAEMMEVLSEGDPSISVSSVDQLQATITLMSDTLTKQNASLESLMTVIRSLGTNHENNPNARKPPQHHGTEKDGKEVSTLHGRMAHMEPNHEAATGEETLENPVYHDIMILKQEIGELSGEMKKYEAQWERRDLCCNSTIVHLVEPLNVSVTKLREDFTSAKALLEEHLQIFHQHLLGGHTKLPVTNRSLDIVKVPAAMDRKMRKQLKAQERQIMRDKKETTLNGSPKMHTTSSLETEPVAFYVRYAEQSDSGLPHNGTYLNYGRGYLPEQGYFKAPHTGVYMVAITTDITPGPTLAQLAFSNGHTLPLTSSNSNKKKGNGSSITIFALLELKKGDLMWFELVQGVTTKQNPPGTSMAGFLIFKT